MLPIVRPSAYGIVADREGRIALARTPKGVFLPGGGMAPGETVAAAIEREVREECALAVVASGWSARAIEHVFSAEEAAQFEKRSTFRVAVLKGKCGLPTETDHVLEWVSPKDALVSLSPPSHRWAVACWMESGVSASTPAHRRGVRP
jgi:8-oxo-dGTP diphosphatase